MIRVVIADDQALVRSGLAVLLASTDDIEVVAEAADGVQALDCTRWHRPDVVLMDLRMPVMDGIEALRRIHADPSLGSTRVLVLTTFDHDEHVYASLRAGASGFLLKDTLPAELLSAVRIVAAGEALLAPSVTRRLVEHFARQQAPAPAPAARSLAELTARECEVLGAVARGLSNAEVGQLLHMSPATAKTHVSRLLAKLDARDRAQLVVRAYEAGLVVAGQ